ILAWCPEIREISGIFVSAGTARASGFGDFGFPATGARTRLSFIVSPNRNVFANFHGWRFVGAPRPVRITRSRSVGGTTPGARTVLHSLHSFFVVMALSRVRCACTMSVPCRPEHQRPGADLRDHHVP